MKVFSCEEEEGTLDENFYPHKNPYIHKRQQRNRVSSTEKRITLSQYKHLYKFHSLRNLVPS